MTDPSELSPSEAAFVHVGRRLTVTDPDDNEVEQDEWPYEHVDRSEIRCSLTPDECQDLREELDRLRELEQSVTDTEQ